MRNKLSELLIVGSIYGAALCVASPANATSPSDAFFRYQVNLKNTGQSYCGSDRFFKVLYGVEELWSGDVSSIPDGVFEVMNIDNCIETRINNAGELDVVDMNEMGISGFDYNAQAAWGFLEQQSIAPPWNKKVVYIGIMDSDFVYNHPDLVDHWWINTVEAEGIEGIDDDGNGRVDDIYGWNGVTNSGDIFPMPGKTSSHGTVVAGIIAAAANNNAANERCGNVFSPNCIAPSNSVVGAASIMPNNVEVKLIGCNVQQEVTPGDIIPPEGEDEAFFIDLIYTFVLDLLVGQVGTFLYKPAVLNCLDYFIDLKTQQGLDIVAVNMSVMQPDIEMTLYGNIPVIEYFSDDFNLEDPIVEQKFEQLIAADITPVMVMGNWVIDHDLEHSGGFPQDFNLPGMIQVAGISSDGNHWLEQHEFGSSGYLNEILSALIFSSKISSGSDSGRYIADISGFAKDVYTTKVELRWTDNELNCDIEDGECVFYGPVDGVSAAAPAVTAAVAMAKVMNPDLNPIQLEALVSSSGADLSDGPETRSGRWLRYFETEGNEAMGGVLSCENRPLKLRVSQKNQEFIMMGEGESIVLEVYNVNCENVGLELNASVDGMGDLILKDNGVFPDQKANDGISSAQWPPGEGEALGAQDLIVGQDYEIDFGDDVRDGQLTVRYGIVVDNLDKDWTENSGWFSWFSGSSGEEFYRNNYRYAATGNGGKWFAWNPLVPVAGHYQVHLWWPTFQATNVPVSLVQDEVVLGDLLIDQTQNGGQWNEVFCVYLEAGSVEVMITNDSTDGHVTADAVKLTPIETCSN